MTLNPKTQPDAAPPNPDKPDQPSLMEIQEKLGLFSQPEQPPDEAEATPEALEEKPLSYI